MKRLPKPALARAKPGGRATPAERDTALDPCASDGENDRPPSECTPTPEPPMRGPLKDRTPTPLPTDRMPPPPPKDRMPPPPPPPPKDRIPPPPPTWPPPPPPPPPPWPPPPRALGSVT